MQPLTCLLLLQAEYEAAGYKLPQIVFWNLRESQLPGQKSTPVTMHQSGAALVSGFRWVPTDPTMECILQATMHG